MKHKHGRKVFLNLFALLVMLLLAGTVAFAEEVREQGGDVCGDSTPSGSAPHSPYGYLPLKIQKIWADGQETHDPVKVSVHYYPNRNHSSGANSQEYTVELNEDNNWSWEFDENWEVHFMEEDVEGYKPEIRYSESAADPEGRYLLTLTNRPAYTVTYNWEDNFAPEGIKGPDDRGLESDQLPGIAKYWVGETVTKHTKQYGSNDDDRVNVDGTVYVFEGWTKAVTESGKEIDINGEAFKMPAENVTITGKWVEEADSSKPKRHTVTYQLVGDTPALSKWILESVETDKLMKMIGSREVEEGSTYTVSNPYYKYAYRDNDKINYQNEYRGLYLFSGWCEDEACTKPYPIDETSYTMGEQDVTIYGKFEHFTINETEKLHENHIYKVTYEEIKATYRTVAGQEQPAPNFAGYSGADLSKEGLAGRYYATGARVKIEDESYRSYSLTYPRGAIGEHYVYIPSAEQDKRNDYAYYTFSGVFDNFNSETKTGTLLSAGGPNPGPGYFIMPEKDVTLCGYWEEQQYTVQYEWTNPPEGLRGQDTLTGYADMSNKRLDGRLLFAKGHKFEHSKASGANKLKMGDYEKSRWSAEGKELKSNENTLVYLFPGWDIKEGAVADSSGTPWITGDTVFTGSWRTVEAHKVNFEWEGLPEQFKEEWPTTPEPMMVHAWGSVPSYLRGPFIKNDEVEVYYSGHSYDEDYNELEYITIGGKNYYFQEFKSNDVKIKDGGYDGHYTFTMPEKEVTITGVWKERTYRVSYTDGCDGELFDRVFYRGNKKNVDTPAFGEDGAITEAGTPYPWDAVDTKTVNGSVVPVREGYSFAGWEKTEGTGGNKWDSTVSECVNYEAKWNPEGIYRLEVHYVDETYREADVKPDIDPAYTYTGNWKAGSKYKIKSPQTVRDYVLAENEPEVIEGTMPSADRIEYVYYTKGKFAPVKYVWTWEEPSSSETGYLEYVLSNMDNAPVLPETQSYAVNSSSKVQIDTSHTAGESLRIDASASGPGAPSIHETFVFSGWYFDEERTRVAEDFILPEEGKTLYGHWSVASGGPTPYTVSYEWTPAGIPRDLPTAKQYLPAREIRVDQTYTNTTEVKINGQVYVFSGWEPKTGLAEDALGADGTFTMPDNNVVFQGKWEPKPGHRVTYEWTGLPEDGTSTVSIPKNNRTYAEGDLFSADRSYTPGMETEVTFADGSRETYTFSGWTSYTAGGTSAELDPDSPSFTMPDADVTISGEWTKKESGAGYYQVEWYLLDSEDADPGTAVPLPGKETVKVTCAWGTEVAAQDSYKTVPGYTFLGTYEHNVLAGTTTAESPLTLKLYFIVTPVPEGNLVITKEVVGGDAEDLTTDFEFTVTLTLPEEEQEELDPNAQADAVPENPAETDNPENHGEPDEPDEPKDPDQPDEPEKPDGADEPKVPDDSDNEEGGNGENEPLEALSYDAGEGEEAEENSEDAGGIGDSTEGEDGESEAVGHEAKSEPVTIKYTDRDGTEKTVVFDDGRTEAVTVYLKHGESIGFNLPTGTEFTVIETEMDGYTTESRGAAGSVEESETYTAAFVNTKDAPDVPDPETYTVTYKWDGRVPRRAELPDGGTYEAGDTVRTDTDYYRNREITQGQYTYTFSGWYMDEARTERADAEFTMPGHDVILYGYWEREREPYEPDEPDPTPPTPPTPTPEPEPEPQPEPEPEPTPPPLPERPVDPGTGMVPYDPTVILDDLVPLAAPHLNVTDHYAYIIGYPDGMVKPLGSITRAEVATIFFRLMLDEYRQENWATENDFPDVTADKWYNNAVSTCAKAGIIKGYPDGTFRPNATITRAEFAAIAARFVSDDVPGYDYFTDMNGHWAQIDVARAVMAGWIKGEGRLFRPNDLMNRAETATLVNRMINRFPDKEHLLEGMIIWPDNPQPPMEKWFYEDIQEATNSHDYEMEELVFLEAWTYLLANRDWAALETEWANAASAPGGEVAPDLQPGGSEDSQGEEPDLSELLPGILG